MVSAGRPAKKKSNRPLVVITYNIYAVAKTTPPAGRRSAMTASTRLTPEQVVERNLRVVDEHFHNENPADIDKALDLDGDVEANVPGCPLPSGTRVSLRVVHIFELDGEGRIIRENGYELWRRADGPINDDIPARAQIVRFD